jgi:hypothetical protein
MDVNVLSAYLPNWLNVLSFPFMGADFSGGSALHYKLSRQTISNNSKHSQRQSWHKNHKKLMGWNYSVYSPLPPLNSTNLVSQNKIYHIQLNQPLPIKICTDGKHYGKLQTYNNKIF